MSDMYKVNKRIIDNYGDSYNASCHSVGINGGCGLDCPVYLEGYCENSCEVSTSELTKEQLITHLDNYPFDFEDSFMMCNKKVCINCGNKYQLEPWDEEDEKLWKDSEVICFKNECPYILEHVVNKCTYMERHILC